jgi:hypothetical protein
MHFAVYVIYAVAAHSAKTPNEALKTEISIITAKNTLKTFFIGNLLGLKDICCFTQYSPTAFAVGELSK